MSTLYDWLSITIFAGLAVLFLQRSMSSEDKDKIWLYLPPAVGCGFANYIGNQGHGWLAVLTLLAVIGFTFHILKPFARGR